MKNNLQTQKAIGGFFELELPFSTRSYHPGAIALSTGRACLSLMLRHLKISKCYVPFYTCNALYDPFLLASVELDFYELNDLLEPSVTPTLEPNEYFLYINYFGIKSNTVTALLARYGEKLIIDNTHLFFHKGYENNWSFTSARKYFGVPDGAYLYSPFKLDEKLERFSAASLTHNVLRLLGRNQESHKEYEKYERSLTSEVREISFLSERLLATVDYERVRLARNQNFAFLHRKLGSFNEIGIDENLKDTPFTYPFLPKTKIDKREFYKDNYFIPNLWLDPSQRDIRGFEFDKDLGVRLLPLPIDHRYDTSDMKKLVEKVEGLL